MSALELVIYPVSTVTHLRAAGHPAPLCGHRPPGWELMLEALHNGDVDVELAPICQRCEELRRPDAIVRPRPYDYAPDGYHWEAAAGETDWRLVDPDAEPRRCRSISKRSERCPNTAVAELDRGRMDWKHNRRLPSWWAYCGEHLYGRWVEDGELHHWRLVADEVAP